MDQKAQAQDMWPRAHLSLLTSRLRSLLHGRKLIFFFLLASLGVAILTLVAHTFNSHPFPPIPPPLTPPHSSSNPYARPRIVASITSFGQRLENISDTVDSLYRQSLRPDALYIHVPVEVKRVSLRGEVLPPIIQKLQAKYSDWLIITRPLDYGPSTKLLGALLLEKDPDTIVITVDDDMSYHTDVVYSLVKVAELHPRHAPCFKCEIWSKEFTWNYFEGEGVCPGWGDAWTGIAYRVGFFDHSIFDYSSRPEGCKLHDDVYISGWLMEHGIRPYKFDPGFFPVVGHKDHTNLSIHVVPGGYENQRNRCIEHFGYFTRRPGQTPNPSMQHLRIKTLVGRPLIEVDVDPSETVLDVKREVERLEGLKVDQQRLIFKAKLLEDSQVIQDLGVGDRDLLHLVLKLRPSQ
ncbi:hypothetical protein HDU67_007939 [Dinochytrium kinnereticum]|nr:hypothetical protein HDU67_007939 [Dinochytrium kinnereticum]